MIMQRHHRRRHPIVPVEYGEEKATNEVCSPVLTSLHNLLPPPRKSRETRVLVGPIRNHTWTCLRSPSITDLCCVSPSYSRYVDGCTPGSRRVGGEREAFLCDERTNAHLFQTIRAAGYRLPHWSIVQPLLLLGLSLCSGSRPRM